MDAPALPSPSPEPPSASLLLPPILLGPAALFWLWVLPLAVLLALNLQGYRLISGNMDPAHLAAAHHFALAGLLNLLSGLVLCAVTAALRSRPAPAFHRHAAWCVPLIAVIVQATYLWLAVARADEILPRSVTAWIYPEPRFFFNQFSFAMLPLALGVLQLACLGRRQTLPRTIATSVGLVVLSPLLLFLLFQGLLSVHTPGNLTAILVATAVVVLSVLFFVGLVRTLLLGLQKIRTTLREGERLAIVLFAFAFPVAGLLLNRSIEFPVDFQAWEVYALVAVNTAILLFASFQHATRPRLSFALLCATFPFSLYFFIVFLPYTPLSLLAVIALGTGFLVLSPTILFVLHLHLLNQARLSPQLLLRPARLALIGLACALLLPGFFTARALADKAALHAALDYVFTPAIKPGDLTYPAGFTNLRRALASHRSYKNGIYYPLLSDAYAWLVFDDLVLPDDKLARLEATFLGTAGSAENPDPTRSSRSGPFGHRSSVRERTRMPRAPAPPRNVEVTQLTARTTPAGDDATSVTVTLTLTNPAPSNAFAPAAEYLKTLPLPAGIFVHGFRLHIDGVPVPGRIFEKKTALWVYTMIRDSERRDPGLLYYRTPDELELRVFPINAGTPATVEIDFLLPGALTADALPQFRDPAALLAHLGTLTQPQLVHTPRAGSAAAGLDRLGLPAVERPPYLHLIIDRSLDHGFTGDLPAALRTLREKFPATPLARITLANYDVTALVAPLTPLDTLISRPAPNLNRALPLSGGLALDLALAHALRQHRDAELDHPPATPAPPPRPVFVILSRHAAPRTLDLACTTAWTDLIPALELHELGADGSWFSHLSPPAATAPLLRLGDSQRPLSPTRATRFASAPNPPAFTYWSPTAADWRPVPGLTTPTRSTPWTRAVALQLLQQDHARSPGETVPDSTLKSLVAASRETGILLPVTSYLVVENSAQWRMLAESEKQKLGQNTALAFRETPAPPALWLALAFIACLVLRRDRARSRQVPAPS